MRMILLAALLPLAACGNSGDDDKPGVAPSGSGNARTFAVGNFTDVDLRGPDDVDVRVGTAFSVRAEGDPSVLDRLKIVRDGDTLRVGRVKGKGFNWSGGGKHAKVFITMPRIAEAGVSGSGNLVVDRAEGAKFEGGIAGSGNLTIATLAVQSAELSIAGSGDIDAAKLTINRAEVSIAGSGNIRAAVDGTAKVSIMGSGDADLGPKARCETSKMGSGSVRCGN